MAINREAIISALHEQLTQDPRVLAVWLEGADATNSVDEYSDIDFCCSVEDGSMASVTANAQAALERLGKLDLDPTSDSGKDYQYTVFHLEGTSPYLLVDFNVYVGRGSQFFEGDEVEKPLVLFDRAGVVKFVDPAGELSATRRKTRLQELVGTTTQYSRIEKYVKRGDFLEAFGYYHKWLLMPLIEVLRMRYTPLHPDYYIVHISSHLPGGVRVKLEDLFQVSSVTEIGEKSREALALFDETANWLDAIIEK